MPILDELNLNFFNSKKLPVVLQTENTECGLACLSMVASYFGYHSSLSQLRAKFAISSKGMTLTGLKQIASRIGLASRSLTLDLEDLDHLKLPCVLHWNFVHFVVLKKVGVGFIIVHDPAFGEKKVSLKDASKCFTGVALELWPNENFEPIKEKKTVKLRSLMGKISGFKISLFQIMLIALALEGLSLISPFFLQWVIDEIVVSVDRNLLTLLAVGFLFLGVIQQILSTFRSWIILHFSTTLSIQWKANVFAHLLRLPIQYFEKRHLGDVVSRFGASDQIQRTLTTSFIEALLDGFMAIITLGMMLLFSLNLTLIVIVSTVLYGLCRWAWYQPLRNLTEQQIIHSAKQQSYFLESVRGIKAIKLFQRQEERRSTWLTYFINQINSGIEGQKLQIVYRLINNLLALFEKILVVWVGAWLILDGKFTVGILMAFISYKEQFDSRISSLIDKYFEVKMLQLQGERLADILHHERECDNENEIRNNDKTITTMIEITNLTYRYSDTDPLVLKNVNLRIEQGESVAIIGPSGCGKTTLINVLLGILKPTSGTIKIAGIDMQETSVNHIRSMSATVLQDDSLFAGSIKENICFFDPEPDFLHIEHCAKLAAVHTEIEDMPMAYNTLIGDMGTVLSGGQKQRILLARALYKKPSILFLDEATSHLDIEKEREVNASISSLNMTRLIVAHRPETIRSADRVIDLSKFI